MPDVRRSHPTGATSPTCRAMATRPACGSARRVPTSNVQIVPPEPGAAVVGATFTPDATSVDFVRQKRRETGEVWRVPFLGGTPRLLISDVSSAISWAPDGQRIAFLRSRLAPTLSTQLIVAAADGRAGTRVGQRSGRRTHRLADGAVATEHPASVVTGRPAHRSDHDVSEGGRTGPGRRQPDRVDAEGPDPEWHDERARLARCRVARGQPASATRLTEPTAPTDIPRRSAVAIDQRSERLHRRQRDQRWSQPRHRSAGCPQRHLGRRCSGVDGNRSRPTHAVHRVAPRLVGRSAPLCRGRRRTASDPADGSRLEARRKRS